MSGDVFGFHNWPQMSFGISWVDTRDAAKHPTRHSTAPTTKSHLTLDVSSAKGESPELKENFYLFQLLWCYISPLLLSLNDCESLFLFEIFQK